MSILLSLLVSLLMMIATFATYVGYGHTFNPKTYLLDSRSQERTNGYKFYFITNILTSHL